MTTNGSNFPLRRKNIHIGYIRVDYKRWTNIRGKKDE